MAEPVQEQGIASLAGTNILASLDPAEMRRIEGLCHWQRFPADQLILDRESTSTDVYFVVEGEVRIVNFSLAGREIEFAAIHAGDYFGDLAAIDGLPRSATVSAVSNTLVAIVSGKHFLEILENHGSVALQVLRRLTQIVRACDDRIMDLSTLSAYQRVYTDLLRMAIPDAAVAQHWVVRPYPPEREIASRSSTTRETVARAMGQLRQSKMVLRKGRNLYILDRPRLEALVAKYKAIAPG